MKKCTWCGKEYPDEATACAVDGRPLAQEGRLSATPQPIADDKTLKSAHAHPAYVAARRNMMVGGVWCVGGIAVTLFTYGAASGEPGGGSYIVAWGAILFGGWQCVRGMMAASAIEKNFAASVSSTDSRAPSASPSRELWTCANCGERLEPQFSTCWKCRHPRNTTDQQASQ